MISQECERAHTPFLKLVWLGSAQVSIIYSEYENFSKKVKHHFEASGLALCIHI